MAMAYPLSVQGGLEEPEAALAPIALAHYDVHDGNCMRFTSPFRFPICSRRFMLNLKIKRNIR
jgi:hypothetical protein